jgi:hypothetical protein
LHHGAASTDLPRLIGVADFRIGCLGARAPPRDNATVAPSHGGFLEQTWSMHDEVCVFVSRMSYDGRLRSETGCHRQRIDSGGGPSGTGLRYRPVEHTGNAQRSDEEARRIAAEVESLLRDGTFTDREGVTRPLLPEDMLVVAPFNLHVHCLREHPPAGVEAGTVDKFQDARHRWCSSHWGRRAATMCQGGWGSCSAATG